MKRGFTIVELLVVIAILAVLAAVTTIAYGSWRERTAINEVKSSLVSAKAAMTSRRNLSTNNQFPASVPFTSTSKVTLTGGATNSNANFCLRAQSARIASIVYYITDSTNNPTTTACTYP